VGVFTGDLLQITDNQTYLGEDLMNVYYYRWFSAPSVDNAVYADLLDDFSEVVIPRITPLQVDGLMHTVLEIKNLSNGVDFAVLPIAVPGQVPASDAEQLPSYISLGFRLLRDSLVTRNGSKRIAGIVDTWITGNDYTGPGTPITDAENAMGENLHTGIIETAAPIIVKRPIVPPVGTSYVYSSVASVLFGGPGTQNTRKP
jgi:hypothetical protein